MDVLSIVFFALAILFGAAALGEMWIRGKTDVGLLLGCVLLYIAGKVTTLG